MTNRRGCVTIVYVKTGQKNQAGPPAKGKAGDDAVSERSFSMFAKEHFLDFRLYQYGREQCGPLYSFGPFVRSHYLFHYVISGKGTLLSADNGGSTRRHALGPGQGFLICPGQENAYCADEDEPWEYVWVEFDGLRAADYLDAAGLGQAQPIYRPQSAAGGDRLRDRMLCISGQSGASTLHLLGQLCLFLDELVQSSSTRRERQSGPIRDFYIQEAVTFIQQNYQRDITVEEIAGTCKLNRSYFSKLFREVIGCTPQEFIIRLRLTKAAEQMRTTGDPVGVIARRCGYPNQLHFSQAFKKRYGLSPREWRKENKPAKKE